MAGTYLEVDNLETYAPLNKAHIVNPAIITHVMKDDFTQNCLAEKISDGDWDLSTNVFNEWLPYVSFKQVFFEGMNWEDTNFFKGPYQAGTGRISRDSDLSPETIHMWKIARCRYLNYLYKAMRNYGFAQDPYTDFISVTIGRDGKVILNNGRHRLACAQLLKIPEIPILIDVRHSEWVRLLRGVDAYMTIHGNRIYSPVNHVDFDELLSRQICRKAEIMQFLNGDTKTVVDLGANWGQTCRALEEEGYQCTAVEGDDIEFSFLSKLRRNYKYEIVHDNVVDFISKRPKWDCVLAMSIFHHLAKTEVGHDRLLHLLRKLDCKEMIFQMPDDEEMRLVNAYKRYTPTEFVGLILSNSCLNNYNEIGNRKTRKMFYLYN